ncbi:MAG: bacteriocin fulvocin C-related protein [Thermoanaerobaculia bacterium]
MPKVHPIILCLVIGAILFTAPALAESGDRIHPGSQKWVPIQHGDDWSPTYDNMVKLPALRQKVVFSGLSPEERSKIWAERIQRYMETHRKLSSDQMALLADALDLVRHTTLFARDVEGTDEQMWDLFYKESLKEIKERAQQLFSRDSIIEIFGNLNKNPNSMTKSADPDCGCNTGSDFCGTSHMCSGGGCWGSGMGCGWVWLENCNGVCARVLLPF